MITKGRFVAVIKNLTRCCTKLFNYFPRSAVSLFPSLGHVRIGKLFHLVGRLLIFFTSSRMKVKSIAEEE